MNGSSELNYCNELVLVIVHIENYHNLIMALVLLVSISLMTKLL